MYRVMHTPLHQWWPVTTDVVGHEAAHALALELSRQHGGEVTVHLLPDTTQEPTNDTH